MPTQPEQSPSRSDRRQFLGRAAATGAGVLVGGSTLEAIIPSLAVARKKGAKHGDIAILKAAQVAEALAVTTYTNIINTAPFFTRLASDDQGYLQAARQEEMSHYLLEKSVTGKPSPFNPKARTRSLRRSSSPLVGLKKHGVQCARRWHQGQM